MLFKLFLFVIQIFSLNADHYPIDNSIFNTNQLHEFQCSDHPNLRINAITEVRDKSLIFFNDIYFTTAKIEVDKFVGEIESFNSVKKLIPNIKGHIQSAFTFGNVTYLLNEGNQMWQYKDGITSGPKLANGSFLCIHQDYHIDAILTHQSKYDSQMLIYHKENNSNYLTFCDMKTGRIKEKYKKRFRTDAIEAFYLTKEKIYQGISSHGYFFNAFQIGLAEGKMRYKPIVKPFFDNQILLGCPHQVCINAKIDAIFRGFSGESYLFVDKYFWKFDTSQIRNAILNVENAKLIHKFWDFLPVGIDASFNDGKSIYFLKDKHFWQIKNISNINKVFRFGSIAKEFNGVPNNIDAAWFNALENSVYFFKDKKFLVYDVTKKVVKKTGKIITDDVIYHYLSVGRIDAVYDDGQNVYLFYENYYYNMTRTVLNGDSNVLKPNLIQEKLFSCKDHFNYSEIAAYHDFIHFKEIFKRYKPNNLILSVNIQQQTAVNNKIMIEQNINKIMIEQNITVEEMIETWNKSVYYVKTETSKDQGVFTSMLLITLYFIVFTCFLAIIILIKQGIDLHKKSRKRN